MSDPAAFTATFGTIWPGPKRSPFETAPAPLTDCAWIQLTQGKWALIDAVDLPIVDVFPWFYAASGRIGYARRSTNFVGPNGIRKLKPLPLHHFLIGRYRKNFVVDHINGDGLDNRRSNLRLVSHIQNCSNRRRASCHNSLGELGIVLRNHAYSAYITINKRRLFVGSFGTIEEARAARGAAEKVREDLLGL